jgi:hypothetical protein
VVRKSPFVVSHELEEGVGGRGSLPKAEETPPTACYTQHLPELRRPWFRPTGLMKESSPASVAIGRPLRDDGRRFFDQTGLEPDQALSPYVDGFYCGCSDAPIHHVNSEHNLNVLVPPVPSDLMIKALEQIGRCRELRRCISSEALETCNYHDHAVR